MAALTIVVCVSAAGPGTARAPGPRAAQDLSGPTEPALRSASVGAPGSPSAADPAHPFAIPAEAPPPYAGHFYAGSVYSGSTENVSSLAVDLAVPDDVPQGPPDFYYVLLSVWDTAGSYDQLGFANDYGSWELAYSTTTECAGTYHYSADALALVRGAGYEFTMTISSGTVTFEAYERTGGGLTSVFTLAQVTGGTAFEIARTFSCNGTAYYDLTDYEEVYTSTGPEPPYDLFFTNNTEDSALVSAWSTFTDQSPSGVAVYPSGANTTIANEPYYLAFTPAGDTVTGEVTSPPTTYYANVSVRTLSPDAPISLASYSLPSGWSLDLQPAEADPPFVTEASFSFPGTTAPGSYLIGLNATDGSGSYARLALTAVVGSSLRVTVSGSPASIDQGQTVAFRANVTGGTGPYSYAWLSLPPGCLPANASVVSCSPSTWGSFAVTVEASETPGPTGVGSMTYTVNSDPQVTPPTATPPSVDVNESVRFTASPTGGSGGFSFDWAGLPPGCSGSSATFACSPTAAVTNASITVKVTDSDGESATSGPLLFTVDPDPFALPPSPSRPAADVGQPVTFTAVTGDGSGGGTFSWSEAPELGCPSTTGPELACVPFGAGRLPVSYVWTDAHGVEATGNTTLNYTVDSDPTEAPPLLSRGALDVGQTVTFRAVVSGGAGGGAYAWTTTLPGCSSSTSATLSCVPTASGTFPVAYVWTDSNGRAAVGADEVNLTVSPLPEVTAPVPSTSGVDVGGAVNFTASLAGVGAGGDQLSWTVSPGVGLGCPGSTSTTLTCRPGVPGTYQVNISVSDANGGNATASTTFEVWTDVVVTSFATAPSTVTPGSSAVLTVAATGGRLPFAYRYTGLPAGCATNQSATLVCTPAETGSFVVRVTVTDANGFSSEANVTLTVQGNGPVPTGLGNDGAVAAAAVAGLGAAAAGAALAVRRRGRLRDGPGLGEGKANPPGRPPGSG